MALLNFLYKFFSSDKSESTINLEAFKDLPVERSWTQEQIDTINAEGPYEKHSPECVTCNNDERLKQLVANANEKLNQALSPPKITWRGKTLTSMWSREDWADLINDFTKKAIDKGGEVGYDPDKDPQMQEVLKSFKKKVRKADYTDTLGIGRTWSSKSPKSFEYSHWLNNSQVYWKALEFDSKYGKEYKHVHSIMRNPVHAYESVLRLPIITARITQLKRMLRGTSRIQNLTSRKLSALTQELARLKALAYHQQLALQWINSELPICVFMEKRTGKADTFLTTQVALAAAKLYL